MIIHIQEECAMQTIADNPIIIFEYNSACITQVTKGDKTKHVSPKQICTHDLHKDETLMFNKFNHLKILQIYKPNHSQHRDQELVYKIGMCHLRDMCEL